MQSTEGEVFELLSTTLIGRSRRCDLRIQDDEVSSQHAEIRWESGHWYIRDLASRNGTFVDGKAAPEKESVRLRPGACLGFGRPETMWSVDGLAPPAATAIGPMGRIPSRAGVLVLEHNDEAVSIWNERGTWWLEDGDAARRKLSEDTLSVGGQEFALDLPRLIGRTVDARDVNVHDVVHRFSVPPSEEGIQLELVHAGRVLASSEKSFTELLYRLAEIWLADTGLPDRERGWVITEDAIRMLGYTDRQHLNVAVCRARALIGDANVRGAQDVVERDRTTSSLRFGGRRIEIVRLR